MTIDPNVLRASFDLIIDRRPDLTVCFHEVLRARWPALAPVLRRERVARGRMLAGAISDVLDHLDRDPSLPERDTSPVFEQVREALLATFAAVAVGDWSPAVEQQWALACGPIADRVLDETMVEAA